MWVIVGVTAFRPKFILSGVKSNKFLTQETFRECIYTQNIILDRCCIPACKVNSTSQDKIKHIKFLKEKIQQLRINLYCTLIS